MAVAIRAAGLGKRYELGASRSYDTLRDVLGRTASRFSQAALGRSAARASRRDQVWALRDVSFEVEAGSAIGVVGSNGSGKSTLLKLLSRITEPTEGSAAIAGRVGSLLEVGTGFHPELTGRENIYLNGAILGMKRSDIERNFDEIVAFAEVERFLETPVKRYSDGMYLRLAFAVAAHLTPEILLVDEVLAVGDARFQKKCLGRMRDITQGEGRTVLFVSHNLGVVQRLCTKSLLLNQGRLVEFGTTGAVIARYLAEQPSASTPDQWIDVSVAPRRGTGEARFCALRYTSGNADVGFQPYPDGPIEFTLEIESDAPRTASSMGVVFSDREGTKLVNADILALGRELRLDRGRNVVRLRITELHLNPGVYDLALWLGEPLGAGYDLVEPALQLEIVALEQAVHGVTPGSEYGCVTCAFDFERV